MTIKISNKLLNYRINKLNRQIIKKFALSSLKHEFKAEFLRPARKYKGGSYETSKNG